MGLGVRTMMIILAPHTIQHTPLAEALEKLGARGGSRWMGTYYIAVYCASWVERHNTNLACIKFASKQGVVCLIVALFLSLNLFWTFRVGHVHPNKGICLHLAPLRNQRYTSVNLHQQYLAITSVAKDDCTQGAMWIEGARSEILWHSQQVFGKSALPVRPTTTPYKAMWT